MGRKVGYARIATADLSFNQQKKALRQAGCKMIFTDIAKGIKTIRPGLNHALTLLKKGDTLVVWKLDRVGTSLSHLIEFIIALHHKGIALISLEEKINLTVNVNAMYRLIEVLAGFEKAIILERSQIGRDMARARSQKGGRPKMLNTRQQLLLRKLHTQADMPIQDLCHKFQISRPTLYTYLKQSKGSNGA